MATVGWAPPTIGAWPFFRIGGRCPPYDGLVRKDRRVGDAHHWGLDIFSQLVGDAHPTMASCARTVGWALPTNGVWMYFSDWWAMPTIDLVRKP